MATSGQVSTRVYRNIDLITHGFRRAGHRPQLVSGEALKVALDLLYTLTSELVAVGFPLWTRQYLLLPIIKGSPDVIFPTGTMEVLHTFWRIINPYRGPCTVNGGSNTSLFSGQPSSDVVLTGPNPTLVVDFASDQELPTVGVLLGGGAPATMAIAVDVSEDGITYTSSQTLASTTFTPGSWAYFDFNPVLNSRFVRLTFPAAGNVTLNAMNFGLANFSDIELGVLNIDDYWNLPNKLFLGDRPNSLYVDRLVSNQAAKIWPIPNVAAFYNGTVTALSRRYIQDPGTLRDSLEVPQRWYECIQWKLAKLIAYEIPFDEVYGEDHQLTPLKFQALEQRKEQCTAEAQKAELIAWGEERTRGPVRLTPSTAPYTK